MTSKDRLLCALNRGQPDRVPFAEHQIAPNILSAIFGEQKAVDPIHVADQFDLDLLSFALPSPLLVNETVLPDGRIHQTSGKLHLRTDLHLLESISDPTDPKLYAELEKLIDLNKGRRAVAGKTRLGLSPMLMSMDLEGFSMALMDDPELITLILKRYVQWAAVAIDEMTRRGVDLIWCFDDFAYRSGPMMSPGVFRDLILPCLKELTATIRLPWVFHSDGDLRPVMTDLLSLGMAGLHPLEPECMSLKELKADIGDRVCLIGNVSIDVLARGTCEQTRQEVRRCLRDGSPGGGYMIASANSVPSYARVDNVLAMVDEIRKCR